MQVPSYNNFVPTEVESGKASGGIAELPRQTFDYAHAMGEAMKFVKQSENVAIQLEQKFTAQMVKADADEALKAFTEQADELTLNPDTGYMAQKGNNARLGYDDYVNNLDKLYDDSLGKITDPRVREAFSSVAQEQMDAYKKKGKAHRLQQAGVYAYKSQEAAIDGMVRSYAANGVDDPDAERTMASIFQGIEYLGHLNGMGDDWVANTKQSRYDLAVSSAITQVAFDDPVKAMEQLRRCDKLSPEVRKRLSATIFEMSKTPIAQRLAQRNSLTSQKGKTVSNYDADKNTYRGMTITSGFGSREAPVAGASTNHGGIDLRAKEGTPLSSFTSGTVVEVGTNNKAGNYIKVRDAQGNIHSYLHLKSINVKKGQIVGENDNLGETGRSGNVSGAHLHYAIKNKDGKVINPIEYRREISSDVIGLDYTDRYNTELSEPMEDSFQAWAKQYDKLDDLQDYDLRGWYKEQVENGLPVTFEAGAHLTDKYKKPNHPTLSDKSKYNGMDGVQGGVWSEDGKTYTVKRNMSRQEAENLKQYFRRVEPGVELKFEVDPSAPVYQSTTVNFAELLKDPNKMTGDSAYDNLTPQQKFAVAAQGMRIEAANRQQIMATLKQEESKYLANVAETGSLNDAPDEELYASVPGGKERYDQLMEKAQVASLVHDFSQLPTEEILRQIDAITPKKGSVMSDERTSMFKALRKAAEDTFKARQQDPIAYMQTNGNAYDYKPIQDFSNPNTVRDELLKRRETYQGVAQDYGVEAKVFTSQEAQGFASYMATLDEAQRADYLSKLSDLVDNTKAPILADLSAQLGKKDKNLSLALGLNSTERGRELELGKHQILGKAYRDNNVVTIEKEQGDLVKQLEELLPYAIDSDQFNAAVEACMNEYAYQERNGESINMGDVINTVIAPVGEYKGTKILLPTRIDEVPQSLTTWTDEGKFEDIVEMWTKDFRKTDRKARFMFGGEMMSAHQIANFLTREKPELVAVGDGVYQIRNGVFYVTDENAVPVTIDVNPYIDKKAGKR